MSYVMVDIEADGPNPGDYSMICFSAVLAEPTGTPECFMHPWSQSSMHALRRLSGAAFAGLLTSSLLCSCTQSNTRPTGDAADNTTEGAGRTSTLTYSVMASGALPLTYQWQRNGTNTPTTTSGLTATTTVTASGVPRLTYQWRFNGTNTPSASNGPPATTK